MFTLIDYAISHARLTIVTLAFLLLAGFTAYVTIPKEAEPDIKIPIVYVQLTQRGISPEDSERLLLRPVETQLKSVGNVKEMRSTAYEGGGYVLLEFEAGFDSKSALADVRAKVDQAKRDLPKDADEPSVQEVNLSLYPVLVVALSGEVPERTMLQIARNAKNAIEQVPGVLAGELRGARDEAVEIIAEPMLLKSYGVSLDQLIAGVGSSNSLIAAGCARRLDRTLRRQGAEPDRKAAGRAEDSAGGRERRRRHHRRCGADQADLQGRDLGDAGQRPAGHDHRGVQAHRREPDRDRRRREEGGRDAAEDLARRRAGDVHPGQVEGHPPDAFGPAELGRDRRAAGRRDHPVRARLPRLAVHRHRDPGVVPGRRARASACGTDRQHRGAVLADPRGRHAGRRRDHRLRVRRAPHGGRHAAARGLFACRQAHVGPGDRGDRDACRCVLAAAVLAGRGRRVHEISADHADRDAVGVARGRAVLHADTWARCSAAPRPIRTTSARKQTASTCAPSASRCAAPARRSR